MPELSLIVPTFNGHRFLRQAVCSALEEVGRSAEIIVVDDGSDDNCLKTISDLPVVPIRLERNRGIAHACNTGLRHAQGEFIGFLDHDDLAAPGGLTKALSWLKSHPEHMVLRGQVAGVIDDQGRLIGSFEKVFYRNPPDGSFEKLLHWIPPMPASITFADLETSRFKKGIFFCALWLHLFRRSLFDRLKPFDENLKVAHDVDFLIRVLKHVPIHWLPFPMAFYRMHENNTSGRLVDGKFKAHIRACAEAALVGLSHGIKAD